MALAGMACFGAACAGETQALKSPNLLRNSSFKQCSLAGLPDQWGLTHRTGDQLWWKDEYLDVCDDAPLPGVKSLRLTHLPDKDATFGIRNSWHTIQCHRTLTLSVYLKSDLDAHKVRLQLGGDYAGGPDVVVPQEVVVGKKWKRYSVTGAPKKGCWFGGHWDILVNEIVSLTPGTLWIAAPQLEFGNQATEYRPADADGFRPAEIEKQVAFPSVRSARVTAPPPIEEIDKLAAGEENVAGPLVDAADAKPAPADVATCFRVCHDDRNLYVLVRCNDPAVTGPDWSSGEVKNKAEWGICTTTRSGST